MRRTSQPSGPRGRTVTVRDNEYFEKTLRRFKKKVADSGVLQKLKDKEFYEKPTSKRRRLKAAAVRRTQKELEKAQVKKPVDRI